MVTPLGRAKQQLPGGIAQFFERYVGHAKPMPKDEQVILYGVDLGVFVKITG